MLPTAVFSTKASAAPDIDLWYGTNQSFGHIGKPQVWVNILGNVTPNQGVITSLTYSLNGGPNLPLNWGPYPDPPRRLVDDGDFNVDIATSDLRKGLNTVRITAGDSGGYQTQTVTVDYTRNFWPLPYSTNWAGAADIQDVAQVVDGDWTLEPGSVSTFQVGYDRVIAIGDIRWENYEITVPVTVHGIDPVCISDINDCYGDPAVHIVARWQGHYNWENEQPYVGWHPIGGAGTYKWLREDLNDSGQVLRGGEWNYLAFDFQRDLPFGTTYIFKLRIETEAGVGDNFWFKMWPQGQSEPAGWDLTGNEPLNSPTKGLDSGSALLVAHNVDASFGDVSIIPILDSTVAYVDNSGSQCWENLPCYIVIQKAVAFVPTGTQIMITSGNYDEDVVLNAEKNITLSGGWSAGYGVQSSTTEINSLMIEMGGLSTDMIDVR